MQRIQTMTCDIGAFRHGKRDWLALERLLSSQALERSDNRYFRFSQSLRLAHTHRSIRIEHGNLWIYSHDGGQLVRSCEDVVTRLPALAEQRRGMQVAQRFLEKQVDAFLGIAIPAKAWDVTKIGNATNFVAGKRVNQHQGAGAP